MCLDYRIIFIIIITRLCILYTDKYIAEIWIIEIFFNSLIENILLDFCCFYHEKENKEVETHIPRHRGPKTKKPRHRESKTKKLWHPHLGIKRGTETVKSRQRYSKAFFQRTKSHVIGIPRLINPDIEIPRPKTYNIEFMWKSDPCTPW